ncbi:MAG TPA: RNA polymerase sigma factor [Burkholderiales bacterium]|nr:RNA polymerase sigma factor [Burkholderiales bacterium]
MLAAAQAALLPGTLSDAELSRRIAQGDMRALEHLMRLHNRTLFRTARSILRDDAEAEDAVQEAYLQAYRSIGAFRGDAKLSTWLIRIVANEALARRRKDARRAAIVPIRGGGVEEHEFEAEAEVRDQDGPESQTQRSELRRLLEQKIDELPESFRAVFMLRALEELPVDETAAALGIPEATVRTRFFRARSQLREALSQEIDLAFDDAFAFLGERCDRIVARVLARLS